MFSSFFCCFQHKIPSSLKYIHLHGTGELFPIFPSMQLLHTLQPSTCITSSTNTQWIKIANNGLAQTMYRKGPQVVNEIYFGQHMPRPQKPLPIVKIIANAQNPCSKSLSCSRSPKTISQDSCYLTYTISPKTSRGAERRTNEADLLENLYNICF